MIQYKGRSVQEGQRVNVYVNLHNGLFSIQCSKSKLVLCHSPSVTLRECTFHISQKGRARAVKEQKRNVHAHVSGIFVGIDLNDPTPTELIVSYNPFTSAHFYNVLDGEEVRHTDFARCFGKRVYCYQGSVSAS